ncbi:MAG: carboxypeptidase regulatory-like domain-containing protein, partial [Nitrospirae bacterium]|nr:carboxypeptidase regulatory-like domain-containing protein [Nitrospirota bacterium]
MRPESARGRCLVFLLFIVFLISANAADVLAAGATVKGLVLAAPGDQPVAGARVILTPASGEKALRAETDAKGLFRFREVKAGIYSIQGIATGYISRYPERITIGPDGGPAGLLVRLDRPGAVSGTVTDEKGGPVAGARISASWGMKPFVVTDADGTFRLTGLAPGTAFLNVRARGFARHQQPAVAVEAGGETRGVSLTLRPGGSIAGRVVHRESGKPLARVQISVSGPAYDSTRTDAAGRFRIDYLAPGAYRVNVNKEGFEYSGTGNIQVEPGSAAEVQPLALSLRPPALDLHLSENVFTTHEDAAIRVRVFRVPRIEFSLRGVPIADYIAALQEGAPSRTLDPARFKIVRTWESRPLYKRTYQEIYGRREKIGKLPAGAYLLTARSEGMPERQALILATDLAVFVKDSPDETLLYASSFRTTRPAAGAEVSVLEGKRVAQTGRTDESGLLRIRKPSGETWGASFVVVRSGKDLAVAARIPSGYRTAKTTKAYVYTDRPVYRPGQEVFFKGIVREDKGDSYTVVPGQKVQMEIRDAAGSLVTSQDLVTNERGAFDGKLVLADEPPLGDYRITARVGADHHESAFRVLEYRKPEYRVIVKPSAPRVVGGQAFSV